MMLVWSRMQKRNLGMVGIWSIARDLPGGALTCLRNPRPDKNRRVRI